MRALKAVVAAALFAMAGSALAFTPESGFWGDRTNSRTGLNFDIQDNILQIAGYLYRADGSANWFTSAGPLTYTYNAQGQLVSVVYNGVFDQVTNGSCLGCPSSGAANVVLGAGGTLRINFTSEIAAQVTYQGRTFALDRFTLALGNETQRMVGEWNVLLDFANRGNGGDYPYGDFPFFGDLWVIDRVDTTRNPQQFQGCRPENSDIGRCTNAARANHDVAGFFDTASGEHVVVVKDVPQQGSSPAVFFAYYADAGTSQFDGVVELYLAGQTPGDGPFYPIRGYRSASRTYVLSGQGPASAAPGGDKRGGGTAGSLSKALAARGALPEGLSAAEVEARFGIDVQKHAAAVAAMSAEMVARAEQ